MEGSILETVGAEIIGIVVPVSICMFLVVLLVHTLNPQGSDSPMQTAATLVYLEKPTDSTTQKFEGALMNAVVFVVLITGVTFLLVLLYYYRCMRFLKAYMCASAFLVLAYMGGSIFLLIIQSWSIPVDAISFCIFLFNFTVVGVLSVFGVGIPIIITQFYMVLLGISVAYWFTMLPEWTTWMLLMALAVYDLVAVLAPGGPLNLLVDLAMKREEEIPALIYEARPMVSRLSGARAPCLVPEESQASRRWGVMENTLTPSTELQPWNSPSQTRTIVDVSQNLASLGQHVNLEGGMSGISRGMNTLARDSSSSSEDGFGNEFSTTPCTDASTSLEITPTLEDIDPKNELTDEESVPLVNHMDGSAATLDNSPSRNVREGGRPERIEISASGGIKLGLGDFVFYSVLVGRAAMYDLMTVYACYLAIISGLGCTLALLAVCRRALPALPISISLGVVFYFLARLLMEPLVVGLSTKLMMF